MAASRRPSSNMAMSGAVQSLDDLITLKLRGLGITLRSVTEATDDTPSGRLLETLLGAVEQFDNDVRAERTRMGMKARLALGYWVWRSPYGYRRGNATEPSLMPDKRAKLVARLFALMETGAHTKASALADVTARGLRSDTGLPLTQETVRKTLINPIYSGRIEYPKWGISVQGDFPAIVSQSTFDRVQSVLSGRGVGLSVPHVADRDEFPLRGFVLCPLCMKPVTASMSKYEQGQGRQSLWLLSLPQSQWTHERLSGTHQQSFCGVARAPPT